MPANLPNLLALTEFVNALRTHGSMSATLCETIMQTIGDLAAYSTARVRDAGACEGSLPVVHQILMPLTLNLRHFSFILAPRIGEASSGALTSPACGDYLRESNLQVRTA